MVVYTVITRQNFDGQVKLKETAGYLTLEFKFA